MPTDERRVYDVRDVIHGLVDGGRMLEWSPRWARNLVCGFARLEGRAVGVIANQPHYLGGVLDADSGTKGARFVRTCNAFGLPLVVLVDTPGFMPGTKQEQGGVIRHGAKLVHAFAEAEVPKVTVVLRKAFGGAFIAMNSRDLGADFSFAWPGATLGVMGAKQAVGIVNRRDIAAAEDPEMAREEFAARYTEEHLSAGTAAAEGYVDEVIAPLDTRRRLIEALTTLDSVAAPAAGIRNIPYDEAEPEAPRGARHRRAGRTRRWKGVDPSLMLQDKKLLITGVITKDSIAWEVARQAQEAGAEVVLTGFGRAKRMTERAATRLPQTVDVLDLDVNDPDQLQAVVDDLRERWGRVDGVLHAIAYAPADALGGNFLETPPESATQAFQTSAYSLKALSAAMLPLMEDGGAIVGMDFDAQVAWPVYDWMGVAKAGLEAVSRYLARDLGPKGVRVNLVSAGPLGTLAANGIPGFDDLARAWETQAPLGWDTEDAGPVAAAVCFLLSDHARAITGEILHVDGGFHAMGTAPVPDREEAVA